MAVSKADIARVAELYGLSLRTLRYYEERGLLNPARCGAMRVYTSQDHLRIKIILTGKRLGFSLSQIHELIDPRVPSPREVPKVDSGSEKSILELLTRDEVQQQLQLLERQRNDVEDAITDLRKSLEERERREPELKPQLEGDTHRSR